MDLKTQRPNTLHSDNLMIKNRHLYPVTLKLSCG